MNQSTEYIINNYDDRLRLMSIFTEHGYTIKKWEEKDKNLKINHVVRVTK